MNPKVQPAALAKLVGREAHEPVTLKLRTTMPLTSEQIAKLTAWGGRLLFDSGIMVVVSVPASRIEEIAGWEVVLEIV